MSALNELLEEDSDYSVHTHECAQLRTLPPWTCECGSADRISSARAELAALRERVVELEAFRSKFLDTYDAILAVGDELPLDPERKPSYRARGIPRSGKVALRRIAVSLARQRGFLTGRLRKLEAALAKADEFADSLDRTGTCQHMMDALTEGCPACKKAAQSIVDQYEAQQAYRAAREAAK